MATTLPDPHPDAPLPEEPLRNPDEITPGQGDIDHPDSVPQEDPGSPAEAPDEITPDQGDTDAPDALPAEAPGTPGADPRLS
ncbi:hypothetical protein [Sphingomonas colocasiae]|uniref:Stereocilin n=1 Tax=Sphingomonas colocasiae TaxID=1848973 RepID=A0ABS7PM43_9SPHN|nr:hypothetical protein [Sphingomonas colocasiae]MBY8821129.1 hypothetical protein [Sphingomonas colocasiae]